MQISPVIVADVGSTNFRSAVASSGGFEHFEIVATPQDPDEFFHVLGSRILHLSKSAEIQRVMVGMPGRVIFSGEPIIQGIQVPGLETPFNPLERLRAAHPETEDLKLQITNDATAAARAAAELYAKDDNQNPLLYLGIGTGLGSDVYRNYQSLGDKEDLPVELGQLPIQTNDGTYVNLGDCINGRSIRRLHGEGIRTPAELYKDPTTRHIWDSIGSGIAQAIGLQAPVWGMAQAVIGGGIGSNCRERIEPALKREMLKIFSVINSDIAKMPTIDFITSQQHLTLGLRGCYLLSER